MAQTYDVVICGGGLAGQTLARQLKIHYPDIDILILEKAKYPLRQATCKVGESTVEIAAFYLSESLNLRDYFKNNHFAKLGLRFFYGDGRLPITDRPELGLSSFPPFDSFQIDRGIFENDLYKMNQLMGIKIVDGIKVQDILLTDNGDMHAITFASSDGAEEKVYGRWAIDAMGRRSFLQRKLKLRIKIENNNSAAWFRLRGRLDIDDFAPDSETQWRRRIGYGIRYFSTNHLMGNGYWVWIIPLPSGITSVGIVSSEKMHPVIDYNSPEKALEWLEKHEPALYKKIMNMPFLDFEIRKNYAYSSKQAFSTLRWACIGEAAVFSDPFYSTGANMIGFANTMVTRMIGLDHNGKLTPNVVSEFNNFLLSYNDGLIEIIHPSYSYFNNAQIMSLNYLWDVTVGWALTAPQMFNAIFLNPKLSAEIRKITSVYSTIALKVKRLFKSWEERINNSFTFDYIDYLSIPFMGEIYQRNLIADKNEKELIEDHRKNIEVIENFALSIFLMAVEDVMPEQLSKCENAGCLNAQAITLDSDKWEHDELFSSNHPKNANFNSIRSQIRSAYIFNKQESQLEKEDLIGSSFDFKFDVK